jgi:hypothetical protein
MLLLKKILTRYNTMIQQQQQQQQQQQLLHSTHKKKGHNIPSGVSEKLAYLRILSGLLLSNALLSTITTFIENKVTTLITFYALGIFFLLLYGTAFRGFAAWSRYLSFKKHAYRKHGKEGVAAIIRKNNEGFCTFVFCTNMLCYYVCCVNSEHEFWDEDLEANVKPHKLREKTNNAERMQLTQPNPPKSEECENDEDEDCEFGDSDVGPNYTSLRALNFSKL